MSHLRLVPPLPADAPVATPVPAQRAASKWEDPTVVALSFFQAASGICLCRACAMRRHPSYGG